MKLAKLHGIQAARRGRWRRCSPGSPCRPGPVHSFLEQSLGCGRVVQVGLDGEGLGPQGLQLLAQGFGGAPGGVVVDGQMLRRPAQGKGGLPSQVSWRPR